MTPNETSKGIDKSILKTINSLFSFSIDSQEKVAKSVEKGIKGLVLNNNGFIKLTGKNIGTSLQVSNQAAKIVSAKEAKKALEKFNDGFDIIAESNNEYFKSEFDNFAPSSILDKTIDIAIENTLSSVIKNNWDDSIILPIRTMINTAIREQILFSELAKQLEDLIEGSRKKGKLSRGIIENHWVRNRVTRDALFQFNANYHRTQGQLTGGSWYQYIGGLVAESRKECIRRVEVKYFHSKEIDDWMKIPKSEWPERIPNVSPYIQRGGYNCLHNLLLISERRVPEERKKEVAGKYGI